MPRSPEKQAALEALGAAVDRCVAAFGGFEEGQMTTAWLVGVCGTRYSSPEYDEDFEDGDENTMVSSYVMFAPDHQQPALGRAIASSMLGRYDNQ